MQMEPPPPGSLPSFFHLYPTQANAASLTFHPTVAALDKRAGPLLQVPRALFIARKTGALPVMCTGRGGKIQPLLGTGDPSSERLLGVCFILR